MRTLLLFAAAFISSVILTRLAIKLLPKFGLMDRQESHSTHTVPVPRGGGIVIFIVFSAAVLLLMPLSKQIAGFLLGGALIFGINILDDLHPIKPIIRLLGEFAACLVVIMFGIGMENISNPLNGQAISLIAYAIPIEIGGTLHYFTPLTDVFTIIWVMTMINMMNWIDGLDGLAVGVGSIAGITLFGLSLLPYVNQPEMGNIAIILVGALLGFLIFNFFPAKIKLGDSGSTFIGYTLAILAIISSGKIATFFLVLGLPFFDLAWVIFRRIFIEKKSPFKGDKKHFHHRLLRAGLTQKQAVLYVYTVTALFGGMALLLKGAQNKLIAICMMMLILITLSFAVHKKGINNKKIL
jgi:UDP-GlcNAc:undecaprenyl-phosphate GlcNAc-1-phosphate transferase